MLRDVVAASGLALFAEVAMLIFLGTFLFVVVRLLVKKPADYDQVARLPIHDDQPPEPSKRSTEI